MGLVEFFSKPYLPQASVTAMSLTSNGDILLAGFLRTNNDTLLGTYISYDADYAFYIARINPDGKLKWINIAESNYGAHDLSALHQKADDGILLGFKFFKDFTLKGSEIVTGNGRYAGLGLAELNPTTGELKKMARLNNTTGSFPKIISIKSDDKNNIFLYGQLTHQNRIFNTDIDAGSKFAFTAKINADFEKIWLRHYPNSENNFTEVMDMEMDKNYNMYITGNFRGAMKIGPDSLKAYGVNRFDGVVAKIDSSGNTIWAKRYGGNNSEYTTGLALDSLNNIYLFGYHYDYSEIGDSIFRSYGAAANRVFITRLDSNGNFSWYFQGGGPNNDETSSLEIYKNKMFASGMFGIKDGGTKKTRAEFGEFNLESPNGRGNTYVLQFSLDDDNPVSTKNNHLSNQLSLQVYPNPTNGLSTVKIIGNTTENLNYQIYNINGKEMQNGQLGGSQERQTTLNLSHLPQGMYLLQVQHKGKTTQHKLYKQ